MHDAFVFIERQLYWRGEIFRRDIMERFGCSDSKAARILRDYRRAAPENLVRSGGRGVPWVASDEFQPRFYRPSPHDGPLPLTNVSPSILEQDQIHVRMVFDAVASSVRTRRLVTMTYEDRAGNTTTRDIQPVRWIAIGGTVTILYAYCFLRDAYRSFELAGIRSVTLSKEQWADLPPSPEEDWVSVKIGELDTQVPRYCVYPLVGLMFASRAKTREMSECIERIVARAMP
jgi:hypothetical protein